MRPSQQRRLLRGTGLTTAVAAAAAAFVLTSGTGAGATTYDGDVLSPALPRPTATLTDTAGRPWSFAQRTPGRITLLFFGYTHCPDVCPTTMADLHQALEHVSPGLRAQTQVVFVSVDPDHDSRTRIAQWLGAFDPAFIGLRAPLGQVVSLGDGLDAGVTPPIPQPDGSVEVQHTSQVYGIPAVGGVPVFWIPTLDGPTLQHQVEHDLPLLAGGVPG